MSKGMKLKGVSRGEGRLVNSYLPRDEYNRLVEEQSAVRKKIADLNSQIFLTKGSFVNGPKADLLRERNALKDRWEDINSILDRAEAARREIIKDRLSKLGSSGIADILKAAKAIIEQLQKALGDNWTDEQRELCSSLRYLSGAQSPLIDMVHRSEVARMQEDHARALQTERAASQLAVNQLRAQIRDLQSQRGKAAVVLRRLYEGKYEEIDTFRRGRGVTHRIHLTAEDCREIEDAIE